MTSVEKSRQVIKVNFEQIYKVCSTFKIDISDVKELQEALEDYMNFF